MNNKNANLKWVFYWILCSIGIYFSSIRFLLNTRDTDNYINEFNVFDEFDFYYNVFEPGFSLIITVVKLFNGGEWAFLFFVACIGVGLKFFAIRKYAPYVYFSLITYFSKYYVLHELTQLRVGIAAGLFLIGATYVQSRKFYCFAFWVGLASLFHYSALVYFILYFVASKKISDRGFLFAGISCVFLVSVFNLDGYIISELKTHIGKVRVYIDLLEQGVDSNINLFNAEILLKMALFMFLYLFKDSLVVIVPCFNIWMRSIGLSIMCFYILRSVPVFAFRISELFDVVMIFAVPAVIFTSKFRVFGYLLFWIFLAAIFYNTYFQQDLISI